MCLSVSTWNNHMVWCNMYSEIVLRSNYIIGIGHVIWCNAHSEIVLSAHYIIKVIGSCPRSDHRRCASVTAEEEWQRVMRPEGGVPLTIASRSRGVKCLYQRDWSRPFGFVMQCITWLQFAIPETKVIGLLGLQGCIELFLIRGFVDPQNAKYFLRHKSFKDWIVNSTVMNTYCLKIQGCQLSLLEGPIKTLWLYDAMCHMTSVSTAIWAFSNRHEWSCR
jgi:hypothetical protein